MRKLDKSKKTDVKCEHCKYMIEAGFHGEKSYLCGLNNKSINYRNKYKDFEWHSRYDS